jgi:hypothetical protein
LAWRQGNLRKLESTACTRGDRRAPTGYVLVSLPNSANRPVRNDHRGWR